jgi:hypothetical protein
MMLLGVFSASCCRRTRPDSLCRLDSAFGTRPRIGTDPRAGRQVGSVYNTTGLNDPAETGDGCPQELWRGIDAQNITKEFDAVAARRVGAARSGRPLESRSPLHRDGDDVELRGRA